MDPDERTCTYTHGLSGSNILRSNFILRFGGVKPRLIPSTQGHELLRQVLLSVHRQRHRIHPLTAPNTVYEGVGEPRNPFYVFPLMHGLLPIVATRLRCAANLGTSMQHFYG